MTFRQVLAGIATIAVIIAVGTGLFFLGSPNEERIRHIDQRRVNDLSSIALQVDLYKTRHSRLPASLEELSRETGFGISVQDPKTKQLYTYRILNTNKYELCAEFERDSAKGSYDGFYPSVPDRGLGFWSHKAGHQCFQLETRKVSR